MEDHAFWLKRMPPHNFKILRTIINSHFTIVYLDDFCYILFLSGLGTDKKLFNVIKQARLAISAKKMELFIRKIRSLGHNIFKGTITPISRAIIIGKKFFNERTDKNMLFRFQEVLIILYPFKR